MTSKPSLCGECPRETSRASNSTTLERENLAKQALSSVDSLPLDLLSLNPNKASDQTNSRRTNIMSSTSNKRLMSETVESLSIPLQDMSSVNWTSSNSTLAPADPDERVPVQSCQLVSQSSMPISLRHARPLQAHLVQPNHKHYWMQRSQKELEQPIELPTSLLKDQILRKLQRNLLHQNWSSDHIWEVHQDTRELLPLQRQSPKLIHDPVHYKANAEVFKSDVEMEEARNYSVHEPQISDEKKASGDMEWTPWSSDFTESELNDWINLLVSYHRMHIFDNTSFDTDQLKARTDSVYNSHRLQETTFGEMKALDRELYFEIYKSTGLDVDGRRTIMSSFLLGIHNEIATVIKFFKQIPGFKHLPTSDQIKLVKGCSHEYHILGLYRGWDNTTRCMTFATLGETLTEQDLRKVFPDEALSAHIQMVMTLQKLNLSSEQIVLLKAIVATAPDRDILEAVEAVTHIHWKLVNCLLYLLCKQDLCPVIKFGQIMSVLTEMRSYSLHIRASYSNIRSDVEELTGKVSLPFIYELFF
ncbi:flocculation protein FLO11 [Biomphalaria glabrata]|nr:flocculation protein FLO11 [Biomphalaria glabrata]